MSKVVINAEITTHEGHFDEFMGSMKEHAAASRKEPGCERFDVIVPRKSENTLIVYEIYENQAALDAHAGSERFAAYREATGHMVAGRTLRICDMVDGSGG